MNKTLLAVVSFLVLVVAATALAITYMITSNRDAPAPSAQPVGYNDPDRLANRLADNLGKAFSDPRNPFYSPGLLITSSTCTKGALPHHFDCALFENNGETSRTDVTVSSDGSTFNARTLYQRSPIAQATPQATPVLTPAPINPKPGRMCSRTGTTAENAVTCLLAAWSDGDRQAAAKYATPRAINELFAMTGSHPSAYAVETCSASSSTAPGHAAGDTFCRASPPIGGAESSTPYLLGFTLRTGAGSAVVVDAFNNDPPPD